jgi:glycerate-2-kinase
MPSTIHPVGPLALKVNEPSMGLFYWVVTRLSPQEHAPDVQVNASDHPYPTHEAAVAAGRAFLKALRTATSI